MHSSGSHVWTKTPCAFNGADLAADAHSIVCGVSAGNGVNNAGQITCGIVQSRDPKTGAPFVVPLYQQPPTTEAAKSPMEVAVSARIRQEALELLKRFLDRSPASKSATTPPMPTGAYPVPNAQVPGWMETVPDVGAIGKESWVKGSGAFL
mmetsp:Transcript_31712/g.62296  ORF Transcript_31712/g.62296 Transcript_31712/m.62296 type:complete len:151 (+) Transcript_31712:53-505(+)